MKCAVSGIREQYFTSLPFGCVTWERTPSSFRQLAQLSAVGSRRTKCTELWMWDEAQEGLGAVSAHRNLLTCVAITGFCLMVLDRAILMNFQVDLFSPLFRYLMQTPVCKVKIYQMPVQSSCLLIYTSQRKPRGKILQLVPSPKCLGLEVFQLSCLFGFFF